ncbi:uncharacterized protein GLRG_01773 [Colletotrichum graminicola M1.001]|uniref:BTB domain-containing protein n=1 Tax=Colletotrichum graminicola (strain M1.001 / M2 / FGSC 10212) TaxID=645133 RepID=E3Q999_COLGM|nr:uncharacterized protein GLRG_01773 [Colletotrichum graminicola M1.001]EFQ27278.1 hypothetical protein GLRG_01773 [Colletotrichum graminicola M1.001]
MELVISYIYAGNVKFARIISEGKRLQTAMQLLVLGNYFVIGELLIDVNEFIFNDILPSITRHPTTRSPRQEVRSVDLEDWVAACRLVYGTLSKTKRSKSLRVTFLKLTFGSRLLCKQILKMSEFKTLCLKYPDFSSDSMIELLGIGAIVLQ